MLHFHVIERDMLSITETVFVKEELLLDDSDDNEQEILPEILLLEDSDDNEQEVLPKKSNIPGTFKFKKLYL